jgi:hypothetical protein
MTPGARLALVAIGIVEYTVRLKDWICDRGETWLILKSDLVEFDSETIKQINLALLAFQEYDATTQTDIDREY